MEAANKDATFKLSLQGGGLTLEREVGPEVAGRLLQLLFGGAEAMPTLKGIDAEGGPIRDRQRVSAREVLNEYGAGKIAEKITGFGFYMREHENMHEFTKDNLWKCFSKAREALSKNPTRDIKATISVGWIAEDHKKPGHYYVTSQGDEALQRRFSSEVRRAVRRRPPRKAKAASDKGNAEANADQ